MGVSMKYFKIIVLSIIMLSFSFADHGRKKHKKKKHRKSHSVRVVHKHPKLKISFTRLTFVDTENKERLTVDINLSLTNGKTNKLFDKLVITEIKQNKYNTNSEFMQIIRDMKIPEMRFSKYCMGMLHENDNINPCRPKSFISTLSKLNIAIQKTHDI